MEGMVFHCPSCGSTVDIDYKTRRGTCLFCGNNVVFPRKQFNGNEKVAIELDHVIHCFLEKRFEEAKRHAENILAVAIDNLPSLFIRAYYESYSAPIRNSKRMSEFFEKLFEIQPDEEETDPLKKLFLSSVLKLDVYEKEVLDWVYTNEPSPVDLCSFVDAFCPIIVSRRRSIDYLTPELIELYKKIAKTCSSPKLVYALLQSAVNNPDSPIKNNSFFLKTKTQRFLNDYLIPIGEIIQEMENETLRLKFQAAFQNIYQNFIKNIKD